MPRVIGRRTFTDADQQRFAAISRDVNPMHVDAVAARRLLSGRQVVHGMHTLIQALEFWRPADAGARALTVQCNFAHPLNVGDAAEFTAVESASGRARLSAVVDGVAVTDVMILRAPGADAGADAVPSATRRVGPLAAPVDAAPESLVGQCFEFGAWGDELARLYPRAAALVGAAGLADLARLSFLVGMVCPGLQSVFASVKFSCAAPPAATPAPLRVAVRSYDPRFRLFVMAFAGVLHGEVRAFVRPPPQTQPRAVDVAARVEAGSWSGRHALVIGGSRGLGEIVAKLLAASGAAVTITYASGRADAEAVAADINALGRGRCDGLALDLTQPFVPPPSLDPSQLDAVFYFATPRIYAKRAAVFNRAAFDGFVSFYIDRLFELCTWLERGAHPVRVYVPSTIFIDDRPKGMTEYAMAKAAAEVLAQDLNQSMRNVRIVHTRLPRLATDQTATVHGIEAVDNVQAMLHVLKVMRA